MRKSDISHQIWIYFPLNLKVKTTHRKEGLVGDDLNSDANRDGQLIPIIEIDELSLKEQNKKVVSKRVFRQ